MASGDAGEVALASDPAPAPRKRRAGKREVLLLQQSQRSFDGSYWKSNSSARQLERLLEVDPGSTESGGEEKGEEEEEEEEE
ncbi:MAG: hypothetical protein Q8P67_23320, partial [archaeon]|nr:hypothetical protein [archaeon]